MTENTDEEPIDNPENIQSENFSDEITPNENIRSISLNQEIENMEVHHHPQLHHKSKPWKEYFLEFLMIFLAVTLGFFAENLREHYVENKRTEEYVHSLYDDLKVDTATLQRTYDEKQWVLSKFDSAQIILASNDISKNNEFIYYVERYMAFNDVFTTQDITYQQLRSSGNFRYIKNIALYKSIGNYYNLYSRYQSYDGVFGLTDKNELSEMESKLFNAKDLTSLDNHDVHTFYDIALPPKDKLQPIKTDVESLNLLYLKIANVKYKTNGSRILLGWLKSTATELIKELKKEYSLE
jgi:hypothetical protein